MCGTSFTCLLCPSLWVTGEPSPLFGLACLTWYGLRGFDWYSHNFAIRFTRRIAFSYLFKNVLEECAAIFYPYALLFGLLGEPSPSFWAGLLARVFWNLNGWPLRFCRGYRWIVFLYLLRRFIKNMGPSFTLGSPPGPSGVNCFYVCFLIESWPWAATNFLTRWVCLITNDS